MIRIFISYRRSDSKSFAHRLHDRLRRVFGRTVFMDVSDIDPGEDFPRIIEARLSSCRVLVAVIGNTWVSCADEHGTRRLQAATDYVRLEVAKALASNMLVVPLLVNGAAMPQAADLPDDLKPLATRNALKIDDDRFDSDIAELIKVVESIVPRRSRLPLIVLTLMALVGVATTGNWLWGRLDRGHGVRLVPGPELYSQLPEQTDGGGMRYELAVQVDGHTATLPDVTRAIIYTGAERPDLDKLQARQDSAALSDELTQRFEGIEHGSEIVAKLARSALTLPVARSKPGAMVLVQVSSYDIDPAGLAKRSPLFECQFVVSGSPQTFFLASSSEECHPATP